MLGQDGATERAARPAQGDTDSQQGESVGLRDAPGRAGPAPPPRGADRRRWAGRRRRSRAAGAAGPRSSRRGCPGPAAGSAARPPRSCPRSGRVPRGPKPAVGPGQGTEDPERAELKRPPILRRQAHGTLLCAHYPSHGSAPQGAARVGAGSAPELAQAPRVESAVEACTRWRSRNRRSGGRRRSSAPSRARVGRSRPSPARPNPPPPRRTAPVRGRSPRRRRRSSGRRSWCAG